MGSPAPGATGRTRTSSKGRAAWLLVLLLAGCASTPPGTAPEEGMPRLGADASPELAFLVARELEADGRFEEALAAYERALAQDPDSPFLLRKAAELSARLNRLDAALVHAERAHAVAPGDPGTRLFLGTLYRLARQPERAEAVLQGADGQPASPDSAVVLYGLLVEDKRLPEARGVAEWLVREEPEGLRGTFALSDVLAKLGDPQGAEAALRRGIARHPDELALYGALARVRRDRGDHEGEIAVYREILAERPDHHGTLLALADAQLALERVDEAVATLEMVVDTHPGDLRSVLRLAFLEFERREYASAASWFQRALAANPEQHEVNYFLGVTERRLRRPDQAMAVFERIPPSHERYAEARTQIAALYEERGDYARAAQEVEQARAQQPSRSLDLYLASLRAKSGDFTGALAFLEGLLVESPDDPEILYNIGVLHGEAKRVDEALGYMEKVLEKAPDHAGALNYVGYTWAEQGTNLGRAEEYVTRALAIRPEDGYIADSLGWIYYMRARPLMDAGQRQEGLALLDRALRELLRAAELTGGDPVISEHLGDAFLLQGDRQRALQMYREAIELGPRPNEQPDLPGKYERLRLELGAQ